MEKDEEGGRNGGGEMKQRHKTCNTVVFLRKSGREEDYSCPQCGRNLEPYEITTTIPLIECVSMIRCVGINPNPDPILAMLRDGICNIKKEVV